MIRITKQADYGIVLLAHFVRSSGLHSARDLAQASHLPLPTVTKVLKMLTKAGVLNSCRGVKGGYGLARSPQAITVADVIEALEGPIAITQCSANAPGCEQAEVCPVRPNWQRIDDAIRSALTSVTLEEMTRSPLSRPQPQAASPSTNTQQRPAVINEPAMEFSRE